MYLPKNTKYSGNELLLRAAAVDPSVGSLGSSLLKGGWWHYLCKTGSYLIKEGECLLSHFAFMLRACFTIGELTLKSCELPVNENFTKNLSLILELCVISLTTSLPKLGEIIVNALISTSSFPAFQKTLTHTHTIWHIISEGSQILHPCPQFIPWTPG